MDVCRPLVSDSHVIQTQGPGLASSVFDMTLATWYANTSASLNKHARSYRLSKLPWIVSKMGTLEDTIYGN